MRMRRHSKHKAFLKTVLDKACFYDKNVALVIPTERFYIVSNFFDTLVHNRTSSPLIYITKIAVENDKVEYTVINRGVLKRLILVIPEKYESIYSSESWNVDYFPSLERIDNG